MTVDNLPISFSLLYVGLCVWLVWADRTNVLMILVSWCVCKVQHADHGEVFFSALLVTALISRSRGTYGERKRRLNDWRPSDEPRGVGEKDRWNVSPFSGKNVVSHCDWCAPSRAQIRFWFWMRVFCSEFQLFPFVSNTRVKKKRR